MRLKMNRYESAKEVYAKIDVNADLVIVYFKYNSFKCLDS